MLCAFMPPSIAQLRAMSAKALRPLTNVLQNSKSPYLLQHKDNPVHWQEWNSDTINLAKELDKPIFLSSGYSACHWCHVFADESFENEAIAKIMNDSFVKIKLDREEWPDIDRMYMTYLQVSADLEPFFAGTYFPRERFRSLLLRIEELWDQDRQRCEELGKNVIESMRDLTGSSTTPSSLAAILDAKPHQSLWRCYVRTHDTRYGGFSPGAGQSMGPKFPSCALTLEPLSRFAVLPPRKNESDNRYQARQMAVHMIRCMWEGGIHDWAGGGFARYSVDEKWRVPHFEKMLYDQAQLISAAVAFAGICVPEISRSASADDLERDRKLCEAVAVNILRYVMRDLRSLQRAFFGAEDADSAPARGEKKAEGGFYLWDKAGFDQVVGEDAAIVGFVFGVQPDGNVPPRHEAHGEMTGKNILFRAHSLREAAVQFGFKGDEEGQIREKINIAMEKLRHQREETRERPGLDDKVVCANQQVVCAWNGLMISGLARIACLLDPKDYPEVQDALAAAEGAVRFVKENMWDESGQTLYRSWREGKGAIAQTDDYACLIAGGRSRRGLRGQGLITALIDLYEATGNEEYVMFARDLQVRQDELFWDDKDKGYFASAADEHVLVRTKDRSVSAAFGDGVYTADV
ncbi:hypothetical protein DB88DRAFT_503435 [Papiliotrema laurentii]|uniref:Spermatogenesis-associated protein 20-like TRX domain-containing protein n=1 Tax=Papiliotrema laurentii TaxID=5418 RepID=A0AAD9FIG5_PAPLA|nr:hypothetical protein DB88DRAFT_503435 [Papiliotrema laurentii]